MPGNGWIAGLAATVVLSALMVMKAMMGVMPELDLPKMLATMMGSPDSPMASWWLARRRTLRAAVCPAIDAPDTARMPSGETMTATRKGYFEPLSYVDSNRGVDALNA
jgi:hypothetical protein